MTRNDAPAAPRPAPRAPAAAVAVLFGLGIGLALWAGWGVLGLRIDRDAVCLSCHEDSVGSGEQARLSHISNRVGLRARCADCHAGSGRVLFLARHVRDVAGFFGHIADTAEQQDAHRLAIASRVWAEMEGDASAGCRGCHGVAAMDMGKLSAGAVAGMRASMAPGASCITCHKGIMHPLPVVTATWFGQSLAELAAASRPAAGGRVTGIFTRKLFLQAGADASPQGSVLPGAEMEVLEITGGLLRVRIAGWQKDGAPRAIYAARGQHILTAALAPAAVAAVATEAEETDPATGTPWRRAALEAWIAPGGLVSAPAAVWSVVATAYGALCSSCHAVPPPSAHSANQWIGTMSGKRRLLPLDDDGNRLLLRYLQLRALDAAHDG